MIRTLIICIFFLASTSTYSYSQNSYALKVDNIEITALIDTLSSITGYNFSYSSDLLLIEEKKSIDIVSDSKEGFVSKNLQKFDLEHEIHGRNVLLRKKHIQQKPNKNTSTQITGYIKDARNESIEYAAIAIPKIGLTVFSDSKGYYEMKVPSDNLELKVIIHMLGFEVIETTIKQLQENQFTTLETRANEIAEILLISNVPPIISDPKNQVLKKTRIENTESGLAGSDLLRSIQYLPGINASDDSSVSIKIRGSSADETLIVLDGIPIYNASHYYGVFSSVNEDYIDEVTIYKNAQPINYGNKTGGIVQLSTLSEVDKFSGKVNASLLESSVTLSTSISTNTQLTLSGRSTIQNISNTSFNSIGDTQNNLNTLDIQNRRSPFESNPSFNFIDLFGKLKYNDNEKLSGQLSFFISDDQFSNTSTGRSQQFRLNENNTTKENWNNLGIGFQVHYALNDAISFHLNSYVSNYSIEDMLNIESVFTERGENNEETLIREEQQFNSIKDIGVDFSNTLKMGEGKLTTGLKNINHDARFNLLFNDTDLITTDDSFSESTLYGLYDHSLSSKTTLTVGTGATYYTGTKEFYFSPQLNIYHLLHTDYSLKFSLSRQNQFLNELSIESNFGNFINRWVLSNGRDIAVSNSTNIMGGASIKKDGLVIDVEFYYKDLNNISEIFRDNDELINTFDPMPLFSVQTGEGRSFGVDVLVVKEFSKLTSQLSYSLSKTEHRFDRISRGDYFLAQDDRRHQFSLLNAYSVGNFSFDLNYTFYSGRRFIDLDSFLNVENRGRQNANQNDITNTLPDYHRVDTGASYKLDTDFAPITIGVGIFNVFNNQNVKYQQQIIGFQDRNENTTNNIILGTDSNLLNRTFNLNLSLAF